MARQGKGALFGQGAMGGISSALDMLLMQKMGFFGDQGSPPQQGEGLPPDRMIGPKLTPAVEAMGNTPMAPPLQSAQQANVDLEDPNSLWNVTPGAGWKLGRPLRRRGR